MSNAHYSSGSVAKFVCGKCHMIYPYRISRSDGAFPKLRVCPECYDFKDPHLLPPLQPDPMNLRWPRPLEKVVAPQYRNKPVYDGGYIEYGPDIVITPVVDPKTNGPIYAEANYEYKPPSSNRRKYR